MSDQQSTPAVSQQQPEHGALSAAQRKILRERGIDDATITAAALLGRHVPDLATREKIKETTYLQGENVAELEDAHLYPISGIVIRYPRTALKEPRHWRLRYDTLEYEVRSKDMDPSGVYGGTEKRECPIRYQCASGQGVIPYIPSLFERGEGFDPDYFRRIDAAAPDHRLYITEAPFKCLSLYAHGYPGVGLGGVLAGAHEPQHGPEKTKAIIAHPELRRINWTGRPAYTVFDAGQVSNPLVALGVAYVWRALTSLGATVFTVTIPELPARMDRRDQGPDDFLVRNGVEAFQRLVDEAYPTDPFARVERIASRPTSEQSTAERTTALLDLSKDLVFRACLHVSSKADHQRIVAASKRVLSSTLIKEALTEYRASMTPKGENTTEEEWKGEFCRAGNGTIRPIGQNVELCLRHDPGLLGLLAFDEFAQNIKFRKAPPWVDHYTASADVIDGTWWAREDYTRLSYHLGRVYDVIDTPREKLEEAVVLISRENRYHPVQDYLRGLTWDGTPRVDTVLQDHLGVTDGDYARLVSRLFLLQAAARVLYPGCKADLVLVLEGDQGIGKSTFLRNLVGDAWFTDEPLGDLADKETAMKLQGHWIVELGEGEILAKASQKALKSFTAKLFDAYVPKYSNVTTRVHRQSVFVITINDSEYLTDTTGNRRYLTVACADVEVDVERFLGARDQLWAEAVHRVEAGEKWHLTRADQKLFASETESRMVEDPWHEDIKNFLERGVVDVDENGDVQHVAPKFLSIRDVLKGIEQSRGAGRRESNRVSDCLRRLGWHSPRDSAEHSREGVRLWSLRPGVVAASGTSGDSPKPPEMRLRKCGTAAAEEPDIFADGYDPLANV